MENIQIIICLSARVQNHHLDFCFFHEKENVLQKFIIFHIFTAILKQQTTTQWLQLDLLGPHFCSHYVIVHESRGGGVCGQDLKSKPQHLWLISTVCSIQQMTESTCELTLVEERLNGQSWLSVQDCVHHHFLHRRLINHCNSASAADGASMEEAPDFMKNSSLNSHLNQVNVKCCFSNLLYEVKL